MIVGIAIGFIAEYYTSGDYKHVKEIAHQSQTGHATNVISGFSIGMLSTFLTVIVLVAGIVLSYLFTKDMYGIALAAVGVGYLACSYTQTRFYVAEFEGQVTIFQGIKEELGPLKFSQPYQVSDISIAEL